MAQEHNSENYSIKRLDHHGIVAGVIKDLNIIDMIDERLGIYSDEKLSAGEAVAGMIINGLGFSNRPLTLTPQFFENKPLSLLFRKGVKADDFNRFKLGRVLDRCHSYGTELLFSEIALNVCRQEQVDTRFNSLDTTSFTLSGDYLSETEDDTVAIKLGHSKDHRPDLKQVMLEMMVSHDGGIPLLGKSLDGNASDNTVFKERSEELIEVFKQSETPRYLIADSKLYSEKKATNLKNLPFITRIPNTIKLVGETIECALDKPNNWQYLDNDRKMQSFIIEHYGIQQRWHVVSSETSQQRAEKQIDKRVKKEAKSIEKQLFHLQVKRFKCLQDAIIAAEALPKKWKNYQLKDYEIIEHFNFESKGRPKNGEKPTQISYQILAQSEQNMSKISQLKDKEGHYVIGSNIDIQQLDDEEVVVAYQSQYQVERGFGFLKDPLFFVSSLFIKKPQRIMGLLMVMLLSLLVYGIAERRMRTCLSEQEETLPNQINQEIKTPTLRWIFQLLDGIHLLKIFINNQFHQVMEGITSLRQKILLLFGSTVANIYQIS
jgi:transposase